MNLPNTLTVSRLLAIPVLMVLLVARFPYHDQVAAAVFVVASLTDTLDGNLARRRGQVTELGKFLDPLFARAARAVAAEGAASVSLIQRKFNVGYSRAGRIVDTLAEHRVIGSYQGSKSREVLMNLPDVDELLEQLGLEG